jgi:hypothetical protein
MKKLIVFTSIALISFSSYAQQPTIEEAKKAFLTIIQTLMKRDCSKYFADFNDSIKVLIPMLPSSRYRHPTPSDMDTIFLSKNWILRDTNRVCSKIGEDFSGKADTSFSNYLKQADIEVFSEKEFLDTATARKVYLKWNKRAGEECAYLRLIAFMPKYYSENDFLILGNVTKEGSSCNLIGRMEWYIYVLRKTNQGWKIFGTALR